MKRLHRKTIASNERGAALIITLWVALILTVLALELAYGVRLDIKTQNYNTQRLRADTLARASVSRALRWLSDANNRGSATDVRLGGSGWKKPDFTREQSIPVNIFKDANGESAGTYSIEIVDESGKLDINTADPDMLQRLLAMRGIAEPELLAPEIIRYRNARPGSKLADISELLNVRGIDTKILYGEDTNDNGVLDPEENDGAKSSPDDDGNGELLKGLASCLTTSPHDAISLNMSPPEVVAAMLDLNENETAQFTQYRSSVGAITDAGDLGNLDWVDQRRLTILTQLFSVNSDRFTVRVRAASPDGSADSGVTVAVSYTGGNIVPYLWREE